MFEFESWKKRTENAETIDIGRVKASIFIVSLLHFSCACVTAVAPLATQYAVDGCM